MSLQSPDAATSYATGSSGVLRRLIATQTRLSAWFDGILPADLARSGSSDFTSDMIRPYVLPGTTLCDVGGGAQPMFSVEEKTALDLEVIGLDIDQAELDKAPSGAYDRVVCADITRFEPGDIVADLVICRTVLEHVRDNEAAFASLAGILKPGGVLLVFVPSKYALFAIANRVLPERTKQRLLFSLFPHKADGHSGFPAFYDRCTPWQFRRLAASNELETREQRLYYWSSYFTIVFPLHAVMQTLKWALRPVAPELLAETFGMALQKSARAQIVAGDGRSSALDRLA